jgi:hypothetical protein
MDIKNTEIKKKNEIHEKNIALYMNYSLGSPPLELHYSMIEDLLSRKNTVTVYVCNAELKSCTANPIKSKSVCYYCKFRDALSGLLDRINVVSLDLDSVTDNVPDTVHSSLELGVMSSMASAVKAQKYDDLNSIWKKNYNNMFHSSRKLFNYFTSEIETNKYDFLFMFNGRFGDVKPALEAARYLDIGYGLYEVKKSLHDIVFINELIHSIDGNTRRAKLFYSNDVSKANETAKIFFQKKVMQENTGDPIYTKNQSPGELPYSLKPGEERNVIVVYPTTDDEYKFIGKEWDGYVPEDQVNEIDQLASNLSSTEYVIFVKMHPNQAHTAENILKRYLNLEVKHPHVHVEEPLSNKDTYALMYRSDFVVNFASTIGVEACYARKIVIGIGDTTFSKMNTSYKAKSGEEAALLILSGQLKAKSIRGAIIWGNYLSRYNDGLTAFSRYGNGDYRVNDNKIGQSKILRIIQLPAKLRLEINKPGFRFDFSFFLKITQGIKNIIKGKWAVK